jgi:small subunit ribosomal protein S5
MSEKEKNKTSGNRRDPKMQRSKRSRHNNSKRNNPRKTKEELLEAWKPVTALGKRVKSGEINSLDQIFSEGESIKEAEIVDALISDLYSDLLLIGQAKGKFGGGKRRIFRQTQKKTREGNTIKFTTCAVVGNKNGYVGVALGKSKETVPARDKAIAKAKLNLIKIRRGCGSWEGSADLNSIPFAVQGKCGSTIITLLPAPRGTGLCVEKECAKILEAAGVKDIWSRTYGQTKTKVNLITACVEALKNLSKMKIQSKHIQSLGVVDGSDGTEKISNKSWISKISEIKNEEKEAEESTKISEKEEIGKINEESEIQKSKLEDVKLNEKKEALNEEASELITEPRDAKVVAAETTSSNE